MRGLEPPLRCEKMDLNHARPPVPPHPHVDELFFQPAPGEVNLSFANKIVAAGLAPTASVLMDVRMPEMGAFECTAIIREKQQAAGSHVPIRAMTAHTIEIMPTA
jgi:hypothetical protein